MTVLVAGVGNIFLRDDGFGPEVARRLAADAGRAAPGVLAVDYGIRGMHLAYDLLAGVDLLVLVDTVPPAESGGSSAGQHPGAAGAPGGPGRHRVPRSARHGPGGSAGAAPFARRRAAR